MKCAHVITALFGVAACVAQAASEEDICEKLADGLEKQVELLADVDDAASAAEVLPELRRVLGELSALNGQCDESALWLYIENHVDVRQELLEYLLRLAAQFDRLQKAEYFGNLELGALLAPQITPAEAAQ